MSPLEMIKAIAEEWFLKEPAFYALYCMQQLQENLQMECGVRVGAGRIEYNPLQLTHHNLRSVETLLRIEMIRLFLKHPYDRRPEGCSGEVITLGSDCTIADGYCLLKEAGALKGPGAYHLPIGQCYEWYCKEIQNKNENDNQNNNGDNTEKKNEDGNDNQSQNQKRNEKQAQSALWQDDALKRTQINDLIERTSDWGSLPGDIVEQIQASTQARLNGRIVFEGFKSNLLSSNRRLSRMRPNRRTGFLQMGSLRQISARLLIAIDCSGSIPDETLSRFFFIVNRLFQQGDIAIDILQFDAEIRCNVTTLQRTLPQFEVHGRGGTNFQPVIDYYLDAHPAYDGLMILTDGEAPPPQFITKPHALLWVCKDEPAYRQHHLWMEQSGRCCWVY